MKLHNKILLGLVVGAVSGFGLKAAFGETTTLLWVVDHIAYPVGQIFLRMLFMIVVPLIFGSVALGVASLGDLSKIGRIGGRAISKFMLTTVIAAAIGITLVNLIGPGNHLDPQVQADLMAEYSNDATDRVGGGAEFGIQTFINIVPRNIVDSAARMDMIGLVFFSLIFGIALTQLPKAKAQPMIDLLDSLVEVVTKIIGYAMEIAPYGVAGLIFAVTAQFGLDVLSSLALYVGTVMLALFLHLTGVVGGMARFVIGIPYGQFFKRCKSLMITAFSTSSSNATLPENIRTAEEEFGAPKEIASFVLPLGATMNMDGTALFEGMTVLFLAQVFGVDLSLGTQLIVVVMAVITSVGAAGVPGGSIPLMALILVMVNVPAEGIALILGVDRILDMSRTVVNVMSDQVAVLYVAKGEGVVLKTHI